MKKNLSNPIVRNILVIITISAALILLGFVAMWGGSIVNWVLSLGWPVLVAIAITALVSGVVFGIFEMNAAPKDSRRSRD